MKRLNKILGVLLAIAMLFCTSAAFATEYGYDDSDEQYIAYDMSTDTELVEVTAASNEDESTNELVYIGGSVLIGALSALAFIKSVTSKHKTVNKKSSANDYVIPGSLNITQSYEAFLYKNVTKSEKQQNNNQQAKG